MIEEQSSVTTEPTGEKLPDAELEVLACLWQAKEATARQVRETMTNYRPMTHGAMVTLLKRLSAKGWVSRKKGPVGKAFLYMPTHEPEPTQKRILQVLKDRIFAGSGVAVVANLLDADPPSVEEIDQLQSLLNDLRSRKKSK